jgi:hypothetical protein
MLIRVFLGWLRGEPLHCKMVAIPTLEEEDGRSVAPRRMALSGPSGDARIAADHSNGIRPAHVRAEKDSFVELDRHPQISLL